MSDVKFFAGESAQLSRVIPEHTHRVSFNWLDRSFSVMGPQWRQARRRVGRGEDDACKWCKYVFLDGDVIALAQPKKGTNWLLCQACASGLADQSTERT